MLKVWFQKINYKTGNVFRLAGMFLLFPRNVVSQIVGFDECFFLYHEDVHICARAWNAGMKIVACPFVSVIQ